MYGCGYERISEYVNATNLIRNLWNYYLPLFIDFIIKLSNIIKTKFTVNIRRKQKCVRA